MKKLLSLAMAVLLMFCFAACQSENVQEEPDMHDIGILASFDPVAVDQACIDLFYPQIGVGKRLDGGRRRVKKYLWSF